MKGTKKTKKKESLHKGEICLHDIIEKSVDGMVILDKGGIVCFVNPAAEAFFDKNAKTLLGKEFSYPVKEGKTTEIDVVRKDGKIRIGEILISGTVWEGKPALLASIRDITERKQLERLKDEFIGTVSHELRTPMTTIREAISQVLDGILGGINEKQKEFLSICLENVDRLKRIVDNLLEVAMLKAGAAEIRRDVVDIVAITEELSSEFDVQAREKGLEIRKVLPKKSVEVYADKNKIGQVFTNLVRNALQFTQKGHIEVGVEDKGGSVECYVSDTGPGIAEENLSRIFGKFQQFERIAGPGEKGTGLGLFIAKGIVEMHHGKISAESKLNKGAKFVFTLPKFSTKEIIYDSIDKRLAIARKEHKGFSVLVIRLDDRSGDAFQKLLGIKDIIRDEGIVTVKGENEIIVLSGAGEENVSGTIASLKRAVKEAFFEEEGINFSYGYSVYPVDASDAEDLFKKASENLVSEKEERLKKKVMIVDDERLIVENLHKFLKKFGYSNITEAYDGAEALEKISAEVPDLIILDMMMSAMNGYEVIGRLKEDVKTEDIPVLIMSGYEVEEGRLKKYADKKAIPAVTKPVDAKDLKRWVDYLL